MAVSCVRKVGVYVPGHELPLLEASVSGYCLCSSCRKLQFCLFLGCKREKSLRYWGGLPLTCTGKEGRDFDNKGE